jgi:hypothetical protein
MLQGHDACAATRRLQVAAAWRNYTSLHVCGSHFTLSAAAAAAEGASCSAELQQLQTLLQEVQGIVQYGSINAASAGLEASQLQQYSISATALEATGCRMQLVLLPHGKGKVAKGDFSRWSGALNDAKALQDWILEQVRAGSTCHSVTLIYVSQLGCWDY